MEMQDIHRKLGNLIEEIYEVSLDELPTNNFRDITIYAEATRNGVPSNKWQHYILKRDRVGFTKADDQHLELLLKTEKLFNITIKDEEAEKINCISKLDCIVMSKLKDKNREDYFQLAIDCKKVKLILIGQDPYPDENDNGIAFCKSDMKLLKRTCFPIICKSLGYDYPILQLRFNNDGVELFKFLLSEGVMFMNLSYELFKGGESNKLIKKYANVNLETIEKLNAKIIKLGMSYEDEFKDIYGNHPVLVHPSRLASRHKSWQDIWANGTFLRNVLVSK